MVSNSISCIIITNGLNNRFLIERTISSIKKTTNHLDWMVEFIVVDNSVEQKVKDDIHTKNIRVVKSKPNHLPKAVRS